MEQDSKQQELDQLLGELVKVPTWSPTVAYFQRKKLSKRIRALQRELSKLKQEIENL